MTNPKKVLRWNPEKQEVEEFEKDKVPVSGDQLFLGNNAWATGGVSVGAGMHSSQVEEFRRDVEEAGIRGVEIQDDGSVKFGSRKARKRYMEFRGLYDKDAGYSDAVPTNF